MKPSYNYQHPIRECVLCGVEFVPRSYKHKYCTKKCYIENFWISWHTDYLRKKRIPPKIIEATCLYCNKTITKMEKQKKMFCSNNCKSYYHRDANAKHKPPTRKISTPKPKIIYTKYCRHCGKLIETTNNRIVSCSRRCTVNTYRKDIQYRIKNTLAQSIRYHLKKQNKKKSIPTQKLTGISVKNLIKHIEKQFKPGMSWSNYGKSGWEIDHIKPCASFDLTKKTQVKLCFHYTNLQPLWVKENIMKSSIFDGKKYYTKKIKLVGI